MAKKKRGKPTKPAKLDDAQTRLIRYTYKHVGKLIEPTFAAWMAGFLRHPNIDKEIAFWLTVAQHFERRKKELLEQRKQNRQKLKAMEDLPFEPGMFDSLDADIRRREAKSRLSDLSGLFESLGLRDD